LGGTGTSQCRWAVTNTIPKFKIPCVHPACHWWNLSSRQHYRVEGGLPGRSSFPSTCGRICPQT
jgi:hypothetical protein